MRDNYLIKYSVFDRSGALIKKGKVKAKNKLSSFEAQVTFERYLRIKYPAFGRLVVHDCKKEFSFADLLDVDGLKDLFKTK